MSLFITDFALTAAHLTVPDLSTLAALPSGLHALIDHALTAICGGLFSTPFYVVLQGSAATLAAGGIGARGLRQGHGPRHRPAHRRLSKSGGDGLDQAHAPRA